MSPKFTYVHPLTDQPISLLTSALRQEIFAFHHDAFITVWNFVKYSSVTWSVPEELSSVGPYSLAADEVTKSLPDGNL
jgi:hypothetical protein